MALKTAGGYVVWQQLNLRQAMSRHGNCKKWQSSTTTHSSCLFRHCQTLYPPCCTGA